MEILACDEFGPSWAGEDETQGGAEIESPYTNPLSEPYLFDRPGSPVCTYGMCPLCNNAQHEKLDALAVRGDFEVLYRMGFTRMEVTRHLVRHVGPAYRERLLPLLEASGSLPEGFLEEKFKDTIEALRKMEARNDRYEAVREKRIDGLLDDGDGEGEPWERRPQGIHPDPGGEVSGGVGINIELLNDPRIGRDYAMDGRVGKRPLAPWTKTRSVAEMALRQAEAINFYDEMMAIRGRAIDVYDRIMGEKQPDGTYEGGLVDHQVVSLPDGKTAVVEGNPKLMSIAVAAVREMSGVVDTLCKMSLIAKRLGDDGPEEELDPAIKSIVDSIGKRDSVLVPVKVIAAEAASLVKDDADRAAAAGEPPMRKVEEEGSDADPA